MNDLGPVVLAVCGLSVVCIGLLAVVAFLVVRFTGGTVLAPLVSLISGIGRDDDDEETSDYVPRRSTSRQSRAASAQSAAPLAGDDFDAAVERYRQQGKSGSSSGSSLGSTPSLNRGSQLSGDLNESDGFTSSSLRRRNRRAEDSEIYDDDDEGDGGLFGF